MNTSEARTANVLRENGHVFVSAYYGLGASKLYQQFVVCFTFGEYIIEIP